MEEAPRDMFMRTLNVEASIAESLVLAGFTTIDEVAYVPLPELLEVANVPEARLLELRQQAREYLLKEALGGQPPPWEGMTDV
jgi:transcription termination/antitermination protein NusA